MYDSRDSKRECYEQGVTDTIEKIKEIIDSNLYEDMIFELIKTFNL